MQDTPPGFAALEIQGLYGPFTFSEKLFQEIWARGDFCQENLRTVDGRPVRIAKAGRWNALGGPDFLGARLKIADGPEVEGDIELHLRAADWAAHRHAHDPAYDRVRLHVVLFPPPAGHVTRGAGAREIPVLVLLPLLHHDLEEYAADATIERLSGRPWRQSIEALRQLGPQALLAELRRQAERRWQQKLNYARLRLERLGWVAACHHAALEILGYRFNRAPMLRLAARYPLADWAGEAMDGDAAFQAEAGRWSLQGVRPANHPRHRLRQYRDWVVALPDWPQRLEAMAGRLPMIVAEASTRTERRRGRLGDWRRIMGEEIGAGQVSGTRLDNLVCDGWLPLLAARTGRALAPLWWHWYPGDMPVYLVATLRELGVHSDPANPACHGPAQGLLGCVLALEAGQA